MKSPKSSISPRSSFSEKNARLLRKESRRTFPGHSPDPALNAPLCTLVPKDEPIEEVPELTTIETGICERAGVSARQFTELREVFRLVDKDGGGTISKDELQVLMQTLGIRVSQDDLEVMVNEIVADAEEIDLESFIKATARKVTPGQPMDVLKHAFQLYDDGGHIHPTGRITTMKLLHVLVDMGFVEKRLKMEEAEDLLSQIAPRAIEDGFFDYDNYLSMLFSQ